MSTAESDYFLILAILTAYGLAAGRWLDTHHVKSDADNLAVAQRMAAVWSHFDVDWKALVSGDDHYTPAVTIGVRLQGLGLLPCYP